MLQNIGCFRNFAFRLLKISIVEFFQMHSTGHWSVQEIRPNIQKKLPKGSAQTQGPNTRLSCSFGSLYHYDTVVFHDERLSLFRATSDSPRLGVLSDSRLGRLGDPAHRPNLMTLVVPETVMWALWQAPTGHCRAGQARLRVRALLRSYPPCAPPPGLREVRVAK